MVSSYCSVVTSDVGAKRTRKLVLRASMTGAADGLVVAIDGLLRVSAPDRADLQPSTSYRVAWRARILSQKALPNLSPISTPRALTLRGHSGTLAQASEPPPRLHDRSGADRRGHGKGERRDLHRDSFGSPSHKRMIGLCAIPRNPGEP